ncbi:MAG: hemerythrin family protein [Oscillospiraceae bacterium]|nr:hemerythrin family protein [Oscillospiraceae bacterium]
MITLSKDMETGVAKIDEQHRELISRINAVTSMGALSVSKEETQKTVDLLGEYIIKHFGDEEALHRQYNYPKYEWHKGQHRMLENEYPKIRKEFAETGPSAKFTLDLNKTIIDWIVRHIKSADVEFGKYYREHNK